MNPLTRGNKANASIALPPVLNIAHRGARGFAPENTLPAFLKAVELFDCPAVELDVHLSKDGELVVIHDDDLRRTTDVVAKFPARTAPYFVSDFTLDELKTLDAGSWFVEQLKLPAKQRQWFLHSLSDAEIAEFIPAADQEEYSSGNVKIPTLEEVLQAVLARSDTAIVNVELKMLPRMYPGLTQKVIDLIARLGCFDRVILSCFDKAQVPIARDYMEFKYGNRQLIPFAALFSDRPGRGVEYLELLEADAYNPGCMGDYDLIGFLSVDNVLDSDGTMRGAIGKGMGVNVWTENNPERMRRMIKEGIVTGVFTDFPNRMVEVLKGEGLPVKAVKTAVGAKPAAL